MRIHIIWFFTAIVALIVGVQFAAKEPRLIEKPVEIVKTKEVFVDRPVEVIKEVPKYVDRIVERKVEVPAKIPAIYDAALDFMKKCQNTKPVSMKEALVGVDSVEVIITLSDDVKKYVSESEIRTKFELTLRRSGVPIKENSRFTVSYIQDGYIPDGANVLYSCTTEMLDMVVCFRHEVPAFQRFAPIWKNGIRGNINLSSAREKLISCSESAAESFANEWLSINSVK